jgi:hypothetical protein
MDIPAEKLLARFNAEGNKVWDSVTPEYTIDQDIFNFYLGNVLVERVVVQYTNSAKEEILK